MFTFAQQPQQRTVLMETQKLWCSTMQECMVCAPRPPAVPAAELCFVQPSLAPGPG